MGVDTMKKKAAKKKAKRKLSRKEDKRQRQEALITSLITSATTTAILDYLKRNAFLGRGSGDLARHLGIHQREAIAHLAVLEKAGLVRHERSEWYVAKQNS
jgi:DNA-binding MarR family transcriptional regulator